LFGKKISECKSDNLIGQFLSFRSGMTKIGQSNYSYNKNSIGEFLERFMEFIYNNFLRLIIVDVIKHVFTVIVLGLD